MEKSALVYIILTAVTVAFGFLVKNRDYTTEYLSGRRSFRGNTSGDLMAAGPDRQQACNAVAEFAIFCLLAGVSACRIAVGGDYWVYWLKFQLIDQGRHVSYETGFVTTSPDVGSSCPERILRNVDLPAPFAPIIP